MKFKVSNEIFEKFPNAFEYIVIARGLNNEIAGKAINDDLQSISEEMKNDQEILKQSPYTKWLEVYSDLGVGGSLNMPEKKPVPAHYALAKRVVGGGHLPNINPLVNFYNIFSLKYKVPIGGEDLSKVYGDMNLVFANGSEKTLTIGESQIEDASKGEPIWVDDHSVTCRLWNWRQSERTKVTKNSKDIYFIFDCLRDIDLNYDEMVEDFKKQLIEVFGATVEIGLIDRDNKEFAFDYDSKDISTIIDISEDLMNLVSKESKKVTTKNRFMKRKLEPIGLEDKEMFLENLGARLSEIVKERNIDSKIILNISANDKFGDVSSSVALMLAAEFKKSPQEIANEIVEILNDNSDVQKIFSQINVAPNGFINFFFSNSFLLNNLNEIYKDIESFGTSNVGKGKSILIESPSINPNAPAHVGHLLNLFLGRSLSRLFKALGFEVHTDNLINDRGIKLCQAMWGIKNLSKGLNPGSEGLKGDHFVGKYYSLAVKEYQKNEQAKEEMDQMLRDWEDGKEDVIKSWKQVIEWAFDGHLQTFNRLKEERGYLWLESDLYKGGKDVILSKMAPGVVEKLSDGAVVGRLEEDYGIDDVVLLRSDGTSIYHTQDIFLTLQKIEKFNPWKVIWVVGNEQIAHFQKLFALLDKLEILPLDNLYHYPYAMVVGMDGKKISSRKGEDASGDGFLDMMHEEALKVIEERNINIEIKDKNAVAEAVGSGALRYTFLSRDPYKDIKFDPKQALSFSGRSGPYIMYAYSRGRSVLRKLEEQGFNLEAVNTDLDDKDISALDRSLMLKISSYPKVVLESADNFSPSILAEYLYDLASTFSNFYENESVLDAEDDVKNFRAILINVSTEIIKKGLTILGIDVLERM